MTTNRRWTTTEQRIIEFTFAATFAAQCVAYLMRDDRLAILLPACVLGIVAAFLASRSARLSHWLRPKRTFFALVTLGLIILVAIGGLIDNPRNPLLMQFSRVIMLDAAFFFLGQLCASLISGTRQV